MSLLALPQSKPLSLRELSQSRNELLAELHKRAEVEVRACLWILRRNGKILIYDPVLGHIYPVTMPGVLVRQDGAEKDAQYLAGLLNAVESGPIRPPLQERGGRDA